MSSIEFTRNEEAANRVDKYYNKPPKLYMHCFGCQQNANDGEKITGVLMDLGYGICDSADDADIIVFNTCAVREHAQQRVFGNIGALKNLKASKPGLLIAVCGCMVQQKSVVDKLRASYPFVDIVFGVNNIDLLPTLVYEKLSTRKRFVQILGEREDIIENMPITRESSFKAWLPIMYGCDNYCSYCIVPYVRGRERSRNSEDIIAEFKDLVEKGYKDITLLGQNVNSYGKNLDEKIDFSDLLKTLDEIEGDYRIRFLTSHPKDANRRLVDTIAQSKHISHHLHLPVQSGCDKILAQMNRKYTAADYLALVNYAKKAMPDMTFSSDVIVGFPGETEEEFAQTLELVKAGQFMQVFTFIYSKRDGTAAADMADPVTYKEKSARVSQMMELQEKISGEICKTFIGKTVKALTEGEGRNEGTFCARLDNNIMVEFLQPAPQGQFVNIKITDSKGAVLKGELQ